MTEIDRDIALALLKRLYQRELISEARYRAACQARCFDRKAIIPKDPQSELREEQGR